MYDIEKQNRQHSKGKTRDKFDEMEEKTLKEAKVIGD